VVLVDKLSDRCRNMVESKIVVERKLDRRAVL
jgi:hypothetical protein